MTKAERTRPQLLLGLTMLLLVAGTQSAYAAGVVNLPCTQTELDTALNGGGLVTFNCGAAPVTITLTSTETIITNTTIDGGGLITIEFPSRLVFDVTGSANFTVQNLTISHSNVGIGNDGTGTVTANNCTFSGNHVWGIVNANYPGNTSTVTATNCTFADNNTGIGNNYFGQVTATNCTFADNFAGILNTVGTVTATNCTFSGNSVVGISNLNPTPPGGATITVTNCILDSTTSNCFGPITDGGHNIDSGGTCGFTGTGCISIGSSFCNTNPNLDPAGLANNGGPTQTIALQAGSPAINTGNETVCAAPPVNNLDQRGFIRPGFDATNCSIGAYEYNSGVDGMSCTSGSQCGGGACDGTSNTCCGQSADCTNGTSCTINTQCRSRYCFDGTCAKPPAPVPLMSRDLIAVLMVALGLVGLLRLARLRSSQ